MKRKGKMTLRRIYYATAWIPVVESIAVSLICESALEIALVIFVGLVPALYGAVLLANK